MNSVATSRVGGWRRHHCPRSLCWRPTRNDGDGQTLFQPSHFDGNNGIATTSQSHVIELVSSICVRCFVVLPDIVHGVLEPLIQCVFDRHQLVMCLEIMITPRVVSIKSWGSCRKVASGSSYSTKLSSCQYCRSPDLTMDSLADVSIDHVQESQIV